MLPVATPPNAIVYGSGKFTIATMMKAGFALNIIGIFVVTLFAYYLAPNIF
jgi:sodium-dependent dicarboxylate transporter 2/3/5